MSEKARNAAQFIYRNQYKYNDMVIEDGNIPSKDIYKELINHDPGTLVEIFYDDEGERIVVDNNTTVYTGDYAYDSSTSSMPRIGMNITDGFDGHGGVGGSAKSSAFIFLILIVLLIAAIIFVL